MNNETTNHAPIGLPKGIGGPAERALSAEGITDIAQLTEWSESRLRALHGVGPKAIRILIETLSAHGLTLQDEPTKVTKMGAGAADIDAYLAGLPPAQRDALQKLREELHTLLPDATECIWYALPTFRVQGKPLIGFGATRTHCALYPMSAATVATFAERLTDWSTSKGTIRFQPDHSLPPELLADVVRMRLAEQAEKSGKAK